MTGDRAERQASAAITCSLMNGEVRNEWHMMHFSSLETDLRHVFHTLYHTRVHGR